MATQYYIQITLKTVNGPETIGKFFAGNNPNKLRALFRKLKGTDEITDDNVICLDFVGMHEGLPLSLDMISCTLDQLGENCKIISKEIFKMHSLSIS